MLIENHSVFSEGINIGRLYHFLTVETDFAITRVICQYKYDIGLAFFTENDAAKKPKIIIEIPKYFAISAKAVLFTNVTWKSFRLQLK